MKHVRLALVLAVLAVLVSACAHPGYHVGVMARLYRRGDCAGAIERATTIEDRLGDLPLIKLAHYHIYRGACHLAMGQPQVARVFLAQAVAIRIRAPYVISGEHAVLLDESLARLAAVGLPVGPPATAVVVVQQAQPAPPPPPRAVPAPSCSVGSDGVQSCGYGCQLAPNGHVYCSSVPGGQCVAVADGSFNCP